MQEQIYFTVVILSALFFFVHNRLNKLSFLVFLIFWGGLFNYLENFIPGLWNFFKIFIFLYSLAFLIDRIRERNFVDEAQLNIIYFFFALSFLITHLINGGPLITILSQFFFKYSSIFILFYIVKEIFSSVLKTEYLKKLLLSVVFIQIFLSFFKILVFGISTEQHVGSVEYGSGGLAVILPIVFLIFLFVIGLKKRTFRVKLFYLLPVIIALASGKRTPVFLFPIYFLFLANMSKKKFSLIKLLKIAPLVLLLFYFGVKTNKTLNPENSNWGSFNFDYVIDYAIMYNFGTSEFSNIDDIRQTSGRGGSMFLLFEPEKLGLNSTSKILFGKGLTDAALATKGRFLGGRAYSIKHYGLMGSATIVLYSLGFIGLILMVFLSVKIIFKTNNNKLKWIIFSFYIFELLVYGNQVMINFASGLVVLFTIFYANNYTNIKKQNKIE